MSDLPLKNNLKPLINVEGLVVKLGNTIVLRDINLKIGPKEIVTIVGPNGAGKSTFLRSIIGVVRPDRGLIHIKAGLRIGYVPQRLQADPALPLTVLRFLSLPHKVSQNNLEEALFHSETTGLINKKIYELSGGELQRVLLARALLNRPQLLILDEANQGLDHLGSISFYNQIELIRSKLECAVLMVSHELHVVMGASDRVVCINGHVCCHGSPEQVASSPEYHALFGSDAEGVMAIYRHDHNHSHDHKMS